jgi:hypothetical protein
VALSAIAFKTDSLRIGPMITPLSRMRVLFVQLNSGAESS